MADARALLRAKRQEAQVTHPLAAYNSAGQLRCIACGIIIKHAAAWEGHVGSKTHRTNVTRLREEERQEEQKRVEEVVKGKRKANGSQDEEDRAMQVDTVDAKKRRLDTTTSSDVNHFMEKPQPQSFTKGGFPADFFSDPSRAPPIRTGDSDEEDEDLTMGPTPITSVGIQEASQPKSVIDLEYEAFQKELLAAPDPKETYDRATIVADPELTNPIEGFPPTEQEELHEVGPDEEVLRQKEQEERELIMDRLLDEERAQEEVDMKVITLKAKLEALKKKKALARASKMQTS
ncbi:hypothetical protein AX16_004984 [Volvariella volvacea WC 439]|nr:hypothetical protein AX16_004984 [Volvariella volvacea WC 439]